MIYNPFYNIVHAQTVNPNTAVSDLPTLINNIVSSLGYLIGVAILLGIIYSAFLFLTSGGNPEKVTKARRSLLYSLVAIVLIVLANIIVYYLSEGAGAGCLFSGYCTTF